MWAIVKGIPLDLQQTDAKYAPPKFTAGGSPITYECKGILGAAEPREFDGIRMDSKEFEGIRRDSRGFERIRGDSKEFR